MSLCADIINIKRIFFMQKALFEKKKSMGKIFRLFVEVENFGFVYKILNIIVSIVKPY